MHAHTHSPCPRTRQITLVSLPYQLRTNPGSCTCEHDPLSLTASWDCRAGNPGGDNGGLKSDCVKQPSQDNCENRAKNLNAKSFCRWIPAEEAGECSCKHHPNSHTAKWDCRPVGAIIIKH